RHHLAEPAGDDLATPLGEEPAHLLGTRLVLDAASDHGDLHVAIVEPRHARGGTLVLGGGFAGSYVARLLGKRGATIVSLENFMLYTPMLPEAASGTLEPRHVVVPLRMMCPHAELLLGRLEALDAEQHVATIRAGTETIAVHYDQAVLALGSYPRALPDYPEFQRARMRWVLVDAAPKTLPEIPTRLGEYAARQLAGRGVEIRTSTTLTSVGPGAVALSGGVRIATHTLVWTAGVTPN